MSFVTPIFFLFLPLVVAIYWLTPHKFRWIPLLGASLFFYAWHNVWLLSLILTTILVSYLCGRIMETAETPKGKKSAMVFCTVVCLGILAIFKYLDFAVGSAVSLANLLGAEISFSGFHILLPMGISFYVFQTMSYVFDVYRGTVPAEKHLGYYALFVTFFPQLVAGPIERPENLLPQMKAPKAYQNSFLSDAAPYLLRGYCKKLLIADFIAPFVEQAYDNIPTVGGFALALATVLFAVQIYCDFSGYSDIALGCGRLMGIRLMENFRTPYAASSVRDFWRRWHISLTDWFTDYVYIPLGGSRAGLLKTCRNILITFLISGLWHGANWTFVMWGGLHGLYLVTERLLGKKYRPGSIVTFLLVCFAWIFFRSATVSDAFTVIGQIFSPWTQGPGLQLKELLTCGLLVALLPFVEKIPRLRRDAPGSQWLLYLLSTLAVVLCRFLVLTEYGETSFIYFQF